MWQYLCHVVVYLYTASVKYVATSCLIQTASGQYCHCLLFLLICEEELYICHQLL